MTFLVLLAILFALDVWLTLRVLSAGGRELNPALAWLAQRVGPRTALIGVKLATLTLIAYFAADAPEAVCVAILAGYVLVVVWNIYQWEGR